MSDLASAHPEEEALLGLSPVAPGRTRAYGPHRSQLIDYYLPAGPVRQRVTLLHGGFWREAYDRTHLSPVAAELARHGWAVALPEYRRVGGDGGWPGTFDDTATVVDTAWDGAEHLLVGHSAGGQLALWAAGRGRLPVHSRWRREVAAVRAVVALAPVADLAYGHRLGLSRGAVAELLGLGQPTPRLAETDPMRLLPPAVPTALLHGTGDPDVPVEISRRYAAASGAELRELAGAGHYAPLIPGSDAFAVLLELLAGCER